MNAQKLFAIAGLLLSPSLAISQTVEVVQPDSTPYNTLVAVNEIVDAVPDMLTRVVNGAEYQNIALVLFLGFATFAIVIALTKYIQNGSREDLIETVLKIGVVRVLMLGYLTAMFMLYEWQRHFAEIIQLGILGTTNEFYAIETIMNAIKRFDFTFTSTGSWNPLTILKAMMADGMFWVLTVIFMIMMIVLLAAAMVVSLLGLWGYMIMAVVGFMLLPTLLFQPLSFLFDGWLRTMFTVLLYAVLGRIVLCFTAFGFDRMLGSPDGSGIQTVIQISPVYGYFQFLGLFLWAAVSLAAMRSVMNYAQSVVAGAGAAMADAKAGSGAAASAMRVFGK